MIDNLLLEWNKVSAPKEPWPCNEISKEKQDFRPKRQKAARRRLLQIQTALENGAGEGIRTLDPNLGKVVLYP